MCAPAGVVGQGVVIVSRRTLSGAAGAPIGQVASDIAGVWEVRQDIAPGTLDNGVHVRSVTGSSVLVMSAAELTGLIGGRRRSMLRSHA